VRTRFAACDARWAARSPRAVPTRQVEARCGPLAFEQDTVDDLEAYCASLVAPETPPTRPPGQPPLIIAPLVLPQSDMNSMPRRGYVSPCAKQAQTPPSEVPPKARFKRAKAGDDSPPLGATDAICSSEKTALYAEVRPALQLRLCPSSSCAAMRMAVPCSQVDLLLPPRTSARVDL
tara:strand:- start:367 stop:897 length:531 start_codon:yes stop_codon:yes gene_type:complete